MNALPTVPAPRVMRIALAALLALGAGTTPIVAQQPSTGIVEVTVEESMGMIGGLLVRSGSQSARTDAEGRARLALPAGRQTISVTGIGIKPARVTVVVVADSVVTATIAVERIEMLMEDVRVSATRT
jgi:hypothetical protein